MVKKEQKNVTRLADIQDQDTTVSDHTIERCRNISGLHGRRPRKSTLLKVKHKGAQLDFAKMHVDKPQRSLVNVLRKDETK